MQRNQKDVSFDITTFCPPYVRKYFFKQKGRLVSNLSLLDIWCRSYSRFKQDRPLTWTFIQPFIHNISSKDQLGASLQYFLRNIQNPPQESSDLLSSAHAAVDVRDVAAAHVDALSTDAAANERFVITGGQ